MSIKILQSQSLIRNYSIILHGMQKHNVVPDIIDMVPPDLATMTYPNGIQVSIGSELKPNQVKEVPIVKWATEDNTFYTICLTDPDAPSRIKPIYREFHHWLVGNIPGANVHEGYTLTEYVGAAPPKGTGLHRYVFLVFKQQYELHFTERRILNNAAQYREHFSIRKFSKKYGLGKPIAGNFFHAQWDDYVPVLFKQLKINL